MIQHKLEQMKVKQLQKELKRVTVKANKRITTLERRDLFDFTNIINDIKPSIKAPSIFETGDIYRGKEVNIKKPIKNQTYGRFSEQTTHLSKTELIKRINERNNFLEHSKISDALKAKTAGRKSPKNKAKGRKAITKRAKEIHYFDLKWKLTDFKQNDEGSSEDNEDDNIANDESEVEELTPEEKAMLEDEENALDWMDDF